MSVSFRMGRVANELRELNRELEQLGAPNPELLETMGKIWNSSLLQDLNATCQAMRGVLWTYFLQLMQQRNTSTDVQERSHLSVKAKSVLDQIEVLSKIDPPIPLRHPGEVA
ncbi:MAG TPA: hypothetical protein VM056_00230 [Terriglobales bacterium]|nr:hypothetical protein [Terriglobales bacterium]